MDVVKFHPHSYSSQILLRCLFEVIMFFQKEVFFFFINAINGKGERERKKERESLRESTMCEERRMMRKEKEYS